MNATRIKPLRQAYRSEHDANVHGFRAVPLLDTQPTPLSWRLSDLAIVLLGTVALLLWTLGVFG